MNTPYATSKYPRGPNPTPSSQSASRRVHRAPINNPYDQFTGAEFDAWIGNITSELRRALGREDPRERHARAPEPAERDDEPLEDSFADLKARRAAKGKERAVDAGDVEQPIVIESDSEDDSEGEEEDENAAEAAATQRYLEEEDEDEDEDEADADAVGVEVEDGDEDEQEEEEEGDNEERSEYEEEIEPVAVDVEIIELSSDEDDEPYVPVRDVHEEQEEEEGFLDNDADGSDEVSDEEHEVGVAKLEQQLDGRRKARNDDDDLSDEEEAEEKDADITALDGGEENWTGFVVEEEGDTGAVKDGSPTEDASQAVDIVDPWTSPRTYAEDFYSGGDFPPDARAAADPHILPTEDEDIEEVPKHPESGHDAKELFILSEKAQPVQSPDPWSGSKTYSEDFYADGDIAEGDLCLDAPTPSHPSQKDEELTGFLTPNVGAPDNAVASVNTSNSSSEEDQATEAREATPTDSLVNELYADFVDEEDAGPSGAAASAEEPGDMDSDSPSPPKFTPHVDWNWPPAFAEGRLATRTGHLASPGPQDDSVEIVEISDDETDVTPPASGVEVTSAGTDGVITNKPPVDREPTAEAQPGSDVQLVEAVSGSTSEFELPMETLAYMDKATVDALYAGIDALIASSLPEMNTGQTDNAHMLSATTDDSIFEYLQSPTQPPDPSDSGPAATFLEEAASYSSEFAEPTAVGETSSEAVTVDSDAVEVGQPAKDSVSTALDTAVDEAPESAPDYEVEEPVTEGRLTVELDDVIRAVSPGNMTEELPGADDGDDQLTVDIREYVVSEPDTELEIEIMDTTLDVVDLAESASTEEVAEAGIVAPSDNTALPMIVEDIDILQEDKADEAVGEALPTLTQEPTTGHNERMLEPGVPMPVSADPTVPDPTSAAPSPGDTGASTPAEESAAPKGVSASRDSSVGSGVPSRGRSPSGLFTPPTADNSPVATPKLPTTEVAEGAFESPLKQVVTVDDLTGEDNAEAASALEVEGLASASQSVAGVVNSQQPDEALVPQSPVVQDDAATSRQYTPAPQLSESSELDTLLLEYPSDSESKPTAPSRNRPEDTGPIHADTSLDVDAEGDLDPDYVAEQHAATLLPESTQVVEGKDTEGPASAITTDDDKLEQTAPATAAQESRPSVADEPSTPDASQDTLMDTTIRPQTSLQGMGDPFSPVGHEYHQPDDDHEARDGDTFENRTLKRKRDASWLPPRVTRSMSLKDGADEPAIHAPKGKASREEGARKVANGLDQDVGSVSGASAVPKSVPTSQPISRASSVASAAPSIGTLTPPSPTVSRTNTFPRPRELPTPPFVEAEGIMHHQHGRGRVQSSHFKRPPSRPATQIPVMVEKPRAPSPSLPPPSPHSPSPAPIDQPVPPTPPPPPPAPSRPPSLPPIKVALSSLSTPLASPSDTQPPSPQTVKQRSAEVSSSQPAVLNRAHGASNSPVTRSNCRFHKISLPREENGPHIHFIVPGCSLTDKELMEEEDIVDHGSAAFAPGTKLIADLDALDFNSYMLGILRQLVGVDLLREQEVFYLPQDGETFAWKPKAQTKPAVASKTRLSARSRKSVGTAIQLSGLGHQGDDWSISAGPSRAGSVSTSGSSRRKGMSERSSMATTASISGSDLSDLSDSDGRSAKRLKTDAAPSPTVGAEGGDVPARQPLTAMARKRELPRRSKRLTQDTSAYKPDAEDGEKSTDEEPGPSARRKKSKRGAKRSRADEPGDEVSEHLRLPSKKRRTRRKSKQEVEAEGD